MELVSEDHLDPNQELTLENVKHRAVKGVIALSSRTAILQIINLISSGVLAVFLAPSEYGIFFLVSAVINFFAYFSDVGLAAALIQKKDKLKRGDLETTFVVQQVLVFALLILILALTPIFKNVYHLDTASIYLLWSLGVSLVFSSLKTIPSVLLERELNFNKLVIPQVVETLLFNIVVVYMAWKGFGIASFTLAVLVRGISGLILIYALRPWKPGLSFSRESLNKLLKFGLPYQANTFLAVIKDDGMTAFLGGILGTSGIGLLGWAQKWAYAPLRFFMDQVIKVTFPAFSRMQNDKKELSNALTKSLLFISLLVFPSVVGLVVIAPVLVSIIPRYEKWTPALFALTIISLNTLLAAITTPLTNFLNAIGKIKTTFRYMIMWSVLSWVFIPFLAWKFGINGAAIGYLIVGLSSILVIITTSELVIINYTFSVVRPLVASIVMGLLVLVLRNLLSPTLLSVLIVTTFGIIIYVGLIYLLLGAYIKNDFKRIAYAIFKR